MKLRKLPQESMRALITIYLLLAFCAALWALFFLTVPAQNSRLVDFMLGQLSILTTGAVGFWINTSKSSSDKNNLLHPPKDDTLDLRGFEKTDKGS